jgi:hypothetical protein
LDEEEIEMPRQNAYVPQTGLLKNCLSVIVDVQPDRMVVIECTQLKQKGNRDLVSFDQLSLACSWEWTNGDVGMTNAQVRSKLG